MINEKIPDPDFNGLGVLDFEKWRPLYSMNFEGGILGRYRLHSRKLVKKNHPDWNSKQVANQAELDFNAAAR